MLSYFKYYIIKTQQARKSIVLKLCGYAAAFRPDVWGCGPTSGTVFGGVEISLEPTPPPSGMVDILRRPRFDFLACKSVTSAFVAEWFILIDLFEERQDRRSNPGLVIGLYD